MPRIDFYFLPQTSAQARFLFACRLLEKAYSQQHQVYVYVEDAEKARFLDQLLWTFRDDSFIPHNLYEKNPPITSPIQIGYTPASETEKDILLNLRPEIPFFYGQFKRILEILPNEAAAKKMAQEYHQFYAEKGYIIHSHQFTE